MAFTTLEITQLNNSNRAMQNVGGGTLLSKIDDVSKVELDILDGATLSTAELNLLDGSVAGTAVAGKAVILDTTGQLDVDIAVTGGASVGHLIKMEGSAGDTYSGTNAGLTVKNYDEDATVIHSGGENGGLAVFAKFLSEPVAGGENVIATFHQHSSSTANPKHGIVIYGDMTNGLAVTGGTATQALSFENQTLTYLMKLAEGAEARTASESCDDVASDGAIKVDIGGVDYFIPLFAAGNVTNSW